MSMCHTDFFSPPPPFLWLLISFYLLYMAIFMQVLFSSGETPDVFFKFFYYFFMFLFLKVQSMVYDEVRWKVKLIWSVHAQ